MGPARHPAVFTPRNLEDALAVGCPVDHVLTVIDYAFQPIVDMATGVVYAYEALLRGTEVLGFKTPADLFEFAFDKGFLAELEARLAFVALSKFGTLTLARGTKFFFNLDGRGLGLDDDPRMGLPHIIKSARLSPSQVCIELTGRHRDTFCDITEHALETLRQTGVLLTLDDFGRGFSELRLLHDLAPDYIKIDRFFLNGIDTDPRRKLFVTTVANLAHVLGSRVIAEGVETDSEYKACRDAGCDLIQGHHVARPFQQKREAKLFYDHIRLPMFGSKRKDEEARIRNELIPLRTTTFDASMKKVLDLFMTAQDVSIIPVLDSNQEPKGIIHERDLKAYLYAGGSDEADYSAALDLPLRSFVRPCPIADIDSNADMLLVTFASSLNSDGIIITQNFRYVGFLSATSLLKIIHEKRIEEAQDQNPLTRMPGNGAVSRFISEAGRKKNASRHLCYFDFDNFKPFNDTYGYRQGDRAIILFGELLQRHVSGNSTFRGHIGGDDFFAGFMSGDQTDVAAHILALKRAFKTDVESFYSAEHRTQGYMEAADRFGATRKFPLLDCSISIVTVPEGICVHPDRLNREIADLKKEAKRSDDGLVVKTLTEADAA